MICWQHQLLLLACSLLLLVVWEDNDLELAPCFCLDGFFFDKNVFLCLIDGDNGLLGFDFV